MFSEELICIFYEPIQQNYKLCTVAYKNMLLTKIWKFKKN